MEQEQPPDEIRRRLMSLRQFARFGEDAKEFICADELKDVLTIEDIGVCISTIPLLRNNQDNGRDLRRYASLIWESSLAVFAILLADANHQHILKFLFRRDTDQRLVFGKDDLYYLPELVRDSFVERQWAFHPVNLALDGVHRDIGPKAILPFLSHVRAGSGGFGTVWKVKVYPRCQTLISQRSGEDVVIARKELGEGRQGMGERRVLSLLNSLKHPHIIEFLGSYSQNGVCNLLFPAASFDLRHFLFETPQIPMEHHAIYANVYGLADALQHIHNFNFEGEGLEFSRIGYHHDLRPANILVCDGKFVIADFGLSKLKLDDQSSRTALRGGQDDYLGPEHFDYEKGITGSVGRSLDVWAFGCILAEIATFIEGKDVGVFRDERKATHGSHPSVTDCAFHLGGEVRPAVSEWLDRLIFQPADPQVAQLIAIGRDMLNPNPFRRPKISEIVSGLQLLAIDSMFVAIDGLLQEAFSGSDGTSMSDQQVCILLEHKRILAFRAAFASLHHAIKLECASAVFKQLQNLVTHLQDLGTSLGCTSEADAGLPVVLLAEIDALCNALSTDVVENFEELWSQAVCNIEDVDILRAIRFSSKPKRYRSVGISAAMKHMSKLISKSIQLGKGSRYLDSAPVRVDDAPSLEQSSESIRDDSKIMGYYFDERVLIEWKEYDVGWKDGAEELFSVMDNLANLLDPEITPRQGIMAERILNCLGYFHERRFFRFGFIYSLDSASRQTQLFSLNNALRIMAADNAPGPDLGDIFQLAKDLAACLLAVHEVGWLHKNLSSHHVLIFAPDKGTISQHVVSAVLSGFNDSRPEASSFTLGPKQDSEHYRHPKYRAGTPFRNVFDYYGLGIVLLELGSWETISQLRDSHEDIKDNENFRLKLLKSYVPQLGERMGARYRSAVQACLDTEGLMNSMGQNPEDSGAAREFFKENVVKSLAGCFA